MDNNKNLMKTRDISHSEIRKMFPKDGDDSGFIDGEKAGHTEKKYTKHSKLSHNK